MQVTPTCIATWIRRLGEIDWAEIGAKYREKLLTPKDFMTHFKLILHNALLTRNKDKTRLAIGNTQCRLCGEAKESVTHLPRCRCLTPIFNKFMTLSPNASPLPTSKGIA